MTEGGSVSQFLKDEWGQGDTEYGAILAFMTFLIVVAAAFTNGSFKNTLSQCFSNVVKVLSGISTGS